MTYAEFLQLLLADLGKAPLLVADFGVIVTDANKLLTDAGIPLSVPSIPHTAETLRMEGQVIDAFKNSQGAWETDPNLAPMFDPTVTSSEGLEDTSPHAVSLVNPRKLGDGTILKYIGTFLQSPLGQTLLGLLLGSLGKAPALAHEPLNIGSKYPN